MKIILTGGGTAGHVTPNIALLPQLRGHDVSYIGSKDGPEKEIVGSTGIPYHGISAGKLRRYLSAKNVVDVFRVMKGLGEARKIIKKVKPDIVFSKGGFVAVPVVYAARLAKVPVIIHESDITVGLANKLCIPHAAKVCCAFPETMSQIPKAKACLISTPIRQEIFEGSRLKGTAVCNFLGEKPVIMVMGGSLGSAIINDTVRNCLDDLLTTYNIIHICGKGKVDEGAKRPGYVQFDYVGQHMADFYELADIVVSRAGANSLSELLALRKPNVLIPLSKKVSRGDQILNAKSFEGRGFSVVIDEEVLDKDILLQRISEVYADRGKYVAAMKKGVAQNSITQITELMEEVVRSR